MDNKTNGEKKFNKCSYIQALQNILKFWFLRAKCPRIIPQKHQNQDSQSMNYITINIVFHHRARKTRQQVPFQINTINTVKTVNFGKLLDNTKKKYQN